MSYFPRLIVFAAIAAVAAAQADAAIVVGLVIDPTATAGSSPDVNSIYSGPGTWHLFAVDDNADDFGISTYNVHLSGATVFRHTSPLGSIQDGDGNVQQAGFNILRTTPGQYADDSIHASQPLPDQSPFLFTGLGQETGNLAAKVAAAQPGSTLLKGATSPSWGTYNSIAPFEGKNWLFLAEGTYDAGVLPTISEAAFTVFTSPTTFRSSFSTTTIVPEPITSTLLTREYVDQLTPRPLPNSTPAPVAPPEPEPIVVPAPPINPPPSPPPLPPVANEDPQEPEPPVTETGPIIGDSPWVIFRNPNIGVGNPDEFLYFDESAYYIQHSLIDTSTFFGLSFGEYAHHSGFHSAMVAELVGMVSYSDDIDGGYQIDSVGRESFLTFNAVGVKHVGVFDSLAMVDAIPAPEPHGVLLAIAAQGSLSILARRRRAKQKR